MADLRPADSRQFVSLCTTPAANAYHRQHPHSQTTPRPRPPKKRGRVEAAAEDATLTKDATAPVAAAAAASAGSNDPLIAAFEALMFYEGKMGNRYAGVAYNKVVKAIRDYPKVIASGAEVKNLAGVGKASVEKIDELLSTGKLKKIDEFAETYGPIPEEMKAALPMAARTAKSGAKAKAGAASSKSVAVKGTPMSAAIKKKVKAAAGEIEDKYKVDELKAILRTNGQTTTGAKAELVMRCAEGEVMGRTPTCPMCSGGKLKFDAATGIYKCPGFMDDDTFMPCFFKGGDITRTKWEI